MGVRQVGEEYVPWGNPLRDNRHDLEPWGFQNRLLSQCEDHPCAGEVHRKFPLLCCDNKRTHGNRSMSAGETRMREVVLMKYQRETYVAT
jgi:hypothetical protein